MEIICPECQFTRVVDETKIPARSQVATCPKCQTKFQFRELPPEEPMEPEFEIEPEAAAEPAEPKSTQPAQATLPLDTTPSVQPDTTPTEKPEDKLDDDPVFPPLAAPGEVETPQTQHPSGEIWDKLNKMTPPAKTKVEEQAESPFDEPNDEVYQAPQQGYEQQQDAEPQQPVPGWTGEFNADFPDPMDNEMDEEEEDGHSPLVPPPFEQLDRYGFFHGLYMTIKLVITSPRLFYSVMPVGGGFSKPLTFAILLTMIQTFVQYFWGMAGLGSGITPEAEPVAGVAGALAPVFMLLLLPAFVAASQFFIACFYHLLLMLMRAANQGFEGTFRALVYSNTPIILGLFPMPMMEIEMGWMLIVGIWGLVLTIIGLKHIHKTSYAKVIPVAIIPLLLAMIIGLLAVQAGVTTI